MSSARRADELRAVRETMLAMLKENGAPPEGRFEDLRYLEPVRDYKARHASTMLTFDAVVDAIDQIEDRKATPTAGEPSCHVRSPGCRMRRSQAPATSRRNWAGPWRKTPGRLLGMALVRLYQLTLSGFVGNSCRHLPTCSEYAYEAIARHGLWAGGWMSLFRVARCGPWRHARHRPRARDGCRTATLVDAVALLAHRQGMTDRSMLTAALFTLAQAHI